MNITTPAEIVRFVARELEVLADRDRAPKMAAYMKTDMPFYGVTSPGRKVVLKEVCSRFDIDDRDTYEEVVRALWAQPHREEKYLAVGVARRLRRFVVMDSLPLYRDLVVEGAWWDFVDEVAAHPVGGLWLAHRPEMQILMDRWVEDPDMWLRRTAILGQLRHKAETDAGRLFSYCSARMHEREFFIRKAIGWALREYSKTDPDAVADFLDRNRDELSGLSYREGAKRLVREGVLPS